jgi:hypothetical protein
MFKFDIFDWIVKKVSGKKKRVFTAEHKKRISEGLQLYHQRKKIARLQESSPRYDKIVSVADAMLQQEISDIMKPSLAELMRKSKILEHGERTMEVNDEPKNN